MGNVNSTSSIHSVPSKKSQNISLSSSNNYRTDSHSTLTRLYHHNDSAATVPTKGNDWTSKYGDRILDISKPTRFEHGIHVEFDGCTGRYMGLPDVWQDSFVSDDVLDTTSIHPILVPVSEGKSLTRPKISLPYNFQHSVHVELSENENGFKGLPPEWQAFIAPKSQPRTAEISPVVTMNTSINNISHDVRSMKIIENIDSLFPPGDNIKLTKRESLKLHLTTRKSSLKVTALKTFKGIPEDIFKGPLIDDSMAREDIMIDNPLIHPSTLYSDYVLIAEGESGPMYVSQHIGTNRVVAIKKIAKTATSKIDKIRNELMMMKMSRHPNVVEYIASYNTQDEIWVVMEFMDIALSDILSLEPDDEELSISIPERLISRIVRDILRALTRIHKFNRIHRDIRSDNVLLNMRGDVKLTDFGLSVQLSEQQPKRNSMVGTEYWMAPELIRKENYDTKVDIWSLGVLIMEMLHFNPPYIEHAPLKAISLIASDGLPPLDDPDRWSDNLKDFLKLCTSMNPEERPNASTLLKHPFITSEVGTTKEMVELIEKARKIETMQQLIGNEDSTE
ncbi:kinase-like domain-containing protein [Pilobolus umbonatus]|nr:kinase-like domain-containing protein [Pilobolus umbonatus]